MNHIHDFHHLFVDSIEAASKIIHKKEISESPNNTNEVRLLQSFGIDIPKNKDLEINAETLKVFKKVLKKRNVAELGDNEFLLGIFGINASFLKN